MPGMGYSGSDVIAVVRWAVRRRLVETLFDPEAPSSFLRLIREDFAEMAEAGLVGFAEAGASSEDGATRVSVEVHVEGCVYAFGAEASPDGVEVDRRAECRFTS